MDSTMRQDLAELVSKYGGNAAELSKELKRMQGGNTSKRSQMEASLDKLLAQYGTISLTSFKKHAAKAWHRAFPEGITKREVKGYQQFVKDMMPQVKNEFPELTHVERMRKIANMWQTSKGTPPSNAAVAVEEASVVDVEIPDEDMEPEPSRPARVLRARRR